MNRPHPKHNLIALTELISGKYFWLMTSMLLMVLLAPLMRGNVTGRILTEAANTFVLIAALYAILRTHRPVVIAVLLILPAALLKSFLNNETDPAPGGVVAMHLLLMAFLIYMMLMILIDVLSEKKVTTDTIKGAVCVYLFMGLFWALAYSLCAFFDPNVFHVTEGVDYEVAEMAFHRDGFSQTVYFSLVTLTTLGYGDITPHSPLVRSLAALEAVVGQIYLIVLVARLVGMHISITPESQSK